MRKLFIEQSVCITRLQALKFFTVFFIILFILSLAVCNTTNPSDNSIGSNNAGVIEQIANSFSARAFVEKEVSKDDIETILKSGAKAPSARNTQPWHFTVVRNADFASSMVRGASNSCVIIVISGPAAASEGINVDFDTALAAQNMAITAQALGLGCRILTGPVREINTNKKEYLKIPNGFDTVAILAIGHVENIADAITGASLRKPLGDIVNYVE